ncbi:MAG: Ig-like domain-containing protein, partial [Gaiellaceae bacterium]
CDAFPGSWATVTLSGGSDTGLATGRCFRYRLRVADNAGNVATSTSASVVKVDTTAAPPAPLALSESEPDEHVSGTTLYYNGQGSYSGTFTVDAAASDGESGIASVSFPLLFGNTQVDSVSPYSFAYDWTGGDTAEGAFTVTATNGAGLTSGSQFTVVRDITPPSGGSLLYANGYVTATSVALVLDDGFDPGSGVATTTEVLRRASASLTDGTCGSFGAYSPIATDPTLAYTDLTVASGTCYRYEYVVDDRVGNTVTYATASVAKVDADPPTGTLTDPGPNLRATVALAAAAADTGGAGVASVEFRRSPAGGGTWTAIGTDTSSPYAASFDTTAVADGLYDLQALVTDGAGNTTASAIVSSRRVDNTPPSASLDDPGAYLRATVNLTATTGDGGSGLASTIFQYAPGGSGSWTTTPAAWNTTLLPDGFYDLRVVVTDNAGNQATSTVLNRKVDNTPPQTTLGSRPPTPDNDFTPTFGFSADETSSFECRTDGGSFAACSSPHTTAALADGSRTFDVRAIDQAGNVDASPDSYAWTLDATPPTVSMTFPAPAALVSDTITLSASATDGGTGVSTVQFQLSPADAGTWTDTSSSWNTTLVSDGRYDLRVIATDGAGNAATSVPVEDVLVDNTAPAVSFTAPAGGYVNASAANPYTLAASATDAGSGVVSVEFMERLDTTFPCASPSSSWSSIGLDAAAPYTADWTLPADGPQVLCAIARDAAGHTQVTTAPVTVDRVAPTALIDAVAPFVRGTIALGSASTDATSGVGQVDFQRVPSGGSGWQLVGSDTTAPFGSVFDTTAVPDGDYDLRAFVTDSAGNAAASALVTTKVDNTPPTGAVTGPAAAANIRLTVTVASDSADGGSGVASAQFQTSPAGAGTWTNLGAADASAPYDVGWDTTTYADGLYDVQVITTDRAGNTFTSAAVAGVRVDNTKPTAAIANPGANLRATVALTGSATDIGGSGVASVEFQHSPAGAGSWTSLSTDTSDPYDAAFDTAAVADGLYDLRVLVTDNAGNQETADVGSRRVDNTRPSVSLTDPGGAINSSVTLAANAADAGSGVASVEFQRSPAGGGSWTTLSTDTSDPYTAGFDTTSVPDGLYDLRVVATDLAGNAETATVGGRRVDNTAPVTSASGVPGGPSSTPVTVTLSASDGGVGVAETKYRLNGGALQTYSGGVTVAGPDGEHTLQYFSVDALGNVEALQSVVFTIDTTGAGGGPGDPGQYLRDVVTLTANPDSDPSGIVSVEFQFSPAAAAAWATIDTDLTAPYSATWNTVLVTDGPYDLQVVVTDGAGNVTQTPLPGLPKIVDNTSPAGSVTGPPEGAIRSGTITISATATDSPAGGTIASVEFQASAGGGSFATIGTDTTAPYTTSWNTTSVPDGPAALLVIVTDVAGNPPTTSAVRNITVDNDAPTVSLNVPGAGGGTITLTASGSGDIDRVVFERSPASAGSWTTISTDTTPADGFSASFNTSSLPDGSYDLRARAFDISGNTGTSGTHTMSVDNANPSGALTDPSPGATVGGPGVQLAASASDGGSGVGSVTFQYRPSGGGPYTDIGADGSAPYAATWDATPLADGAYDLRVLVVDNAGNSFTSAPVGVTLDSTAPTVSLASPGTNLSGTVTLSATTSGGVPTSVSFGVSPAGAGSWSEIGADPSAPYSVDFGTGSVGDGLYDLRAVVSDAYGNTNQSVRPGIRIDNTAPRLVTSTPADGATVSSVSTIQLSASEALAGVEAVTLDGAAVTATVSGNGATFDVSLGDGPHTLRGTLRDLSGKTAVFIVHFTIGSGSGGDAPYVEMNVQPGTGGTLVAADDSASVTLPPGAYSVSGDWIVLRIDTAPPPGSVGGGFVPAAQVWDVTARLALAGTEIHDFAAPLQILIPGASGAVVPATFEAGRWRPIPRVTAGSSLPPGLRDGFWRDEAGVHILTLHLSLFTLLGDIEPPDPPHSLEGVVGAGGLSLRWVPGKDNSGLVDAVTLYVNGERYASFQPAQRETSMGAFAADDTRVFTWREVDLAGNVSAETRRLRALPALVGKTLSEAQAALNDRGFAVGTVTEQPSSAPPGTVIEPSGVTLAVEGTPVSLVVAAAGFTAQAKLAFKVVGTKTLDPRTRGYVAVRVTSSRAAAVKATLTTGSGKRLATWRLKAKAGALIVKLRLPARARRPGRYRIAFAATAEGDTILRTIRVQMTGPRKAAGGTRRPRPRVEVVLTGDAAERGGIARGVDGRVTRSVKAEGDATFDVTGNTRRNVEVVVVDVDRYGLGLVRDLRTVFPDVKILALTNDPKLLARAVKAGATIALPRSTPDAQIARVIKRLAARR